jgi:hypothetical protein
VLLYFSLGLVGGRREQIIGVFFRRVGWIDLKFVGFKDGRCCALPKFYRGLVKVRRERVNKIFLGKWDSMFRARKVSRFLVLRIPM